MHEVVKRVLSVTIGTQTPIYGRPARSLATSQKGARDSAVGIATGDWLEFESRYVKEFSLLYVVQTGPGAHPASYPMGIGALSLGVKRSGREADHSLPTGAEVEKTWIYTATPTYVFMAQCLIS
jgi:hypothetical protein